jgi:hypothetical protein
LIVATSEAKNSLETTLCASQFQGNSAASANPNADLKSRNRKNLLWPIAGFALGVIVATNPFYQPHFSQEVGAAAWFADLALVLILSMHRIAGRIGILLAGLFFAVPCFVHASPLSRGLLMCGMALPFVIATVPLFAPPTAGFRGRLAYFFSWMGTQKITRRPASFDLVALLHLILATMVFAGSVACVKIVPAVGIWLLARWLAGGIMFLAFAEMATASHEFLTARMEIIAPAMMQSPFLATSIGEFWAKRWNRVASALLFRGLFFAPFARRGIVLALFLAFLASAVAHLLLAFMALGRWNISIMCGAFFFVQPLFILVERRIKVRRWPITAARVWTLAALTVTSPLFVEPALQILTPTLDTTNSFLVPTIATVAFVMIVNLIFSVGPLLSCPRFRQPGAAAAASL